MADYAGIFAMLAMGGLVVGGLLGLQRVLTSGSTATGETRADPAPGSDPEPGAEPVASRAGRSGPQTRLRVGFLLGALVFLTVLAGLIGLIPWALAARELGMTGLLGFVAFTLPLLVGLLHAASRGSLEW